MNSISQTQSHLRKTRNMLSWLEFCICIKKNKLTHDPGFGLCAKHGDRVSQIPQWMNVEDFIVLRKVYKRKLIGFKIEMLKHRRQKAVDYIELLRQLNTKHALAETFIADITNKINLLSVVAKR